jgi:hypothetical protein
MLRKQALNNLAFTVPKNRKVWNRPFSYLAIERILFRRCVVTSRADRVGRSSPNSTLAFASSI